ncbi:transporter substrate-binding domain-containing protein [Bacteroides sp.]|uniref:transporter substrate-binding domain-containing protein n=1 Tax=Bacteroides sp. TaxID=29523 RepID=UPI00260BD98E|nr:transporter substrate-binding domain-containing protein [Bacteroides sp.]MDD3038242.1 transporter substrate-binding domain-containing protein [Bacteroides sp.]
MASGKYDAVLSFDISSFYFVRKGKYDKLLVHLTDIDPERYSVVVNTNNEDLLYMLNATIYQMKIDGEYDKIYYKWFGVYESPKISKVVWYILVLFGGCLILFGIFIRVLRIQVNHATNSQPGIVYLKNIIDRLHGTIGVESEVGVGSKFWIQLLIAKKEGE